MTLQFTIEWDTSKLTDHLQFLQTGQHLSISEVKVGVHDCECIKCCMNNSYNVYWSISHSKSVWNEPFTAFYGTSPISVEIEEVSCNTELPTFEPLSNTLLALPFIHVPYIPPLKNNDGILSCCSEYGYVDDKSLYIHNYRNNRLYWYRTPIVIPMTLCSPKLRIKIYCEEWLEYVVGEQYGSMYLS